MIIVWPFLRTVSSHRVQFICSHSYLFLKFLAYIRDSIDVEWKKCFTLGDSVESSLQKKLNKHKQSLQANIMEYPRKEATDILPPHYIVCGGGSNEAFTTDLQLLFPTFSSSG